MRIFVIISILFYISCEKTESPKPICKTICEHGDFHGVFLLNDKCFSSDNLIFTKDGDYYLINLRKSGPISEGVSFVIFPTANFKDTLFLESSFNLKVNECGVFYNYFEGASVAGSWDIPKDKGTNHDFLIIDSFNSDTTIIEGRFQCKFQERFVNLFVNAPDTLNISCGSFKIKRE